MIQARFTNRKYGGLIGSARFHDDEEIGNAHVGDGVKVHFAIPAAWGQALERYIEGDPSLPVAVETTATGYDAMIPFVIKSRRHEWTHERNANPFKEGRLHVRAYTLFLEPETGWGEDVLLWIMQGRPPEWIGKIEEEEEGEGA